MPNEKDDEKPEVNEYKLYLKPECNHSFQYVASMEIECTKCHCGFSMTPGAELKENHVYFHGMRLL